MRVGQRVQARLRGDCRLGAGAGPGGRLAAESKPSHRTREESAAGNGRTKQAMCAPTPAWSVPLLHDRYT